MPKKAFHRQYEHHEYVVMPFGLTNALIAFMDLISIVFNPSLNKFIIVFIGDILVYSRTPEEHISHMREVLEVLRRNELYAKLAKCEFWLKKVALSGYILSM